MGKGEVASERNGLEFPQSCSLTVVELETEEPGEIGRVGTGWVHLPLLHSLVFLHCFSSLAFSVLLDDHSKTM